MGEGTLSAGRGDAGGRGSVDADVDQRCWRVCSRPRVGGRLVSVSVDVVVFTPAVQKPSRMGEEQETRRGCMSNDTERRDAQPRDSIQMIFFDRWLAGQDEPFVSIPQMSQTKEEEQVRPPPLPAGAAGEKLGRLPKK